AILRQVVEVNFFAPVELLRRAVPILKQGEQPAVVNVASMCGRRGVPMWSEYSASKFALCGFSEAVRSELLLSGIDVLIILAGLTRTLLPKTLVRSDPRMYADFAQGMDPDWGARRILRALRRNRRETILGRETFWVLLTNRYFPRLLDAVMDGFVRRRYG